MDLTIADYETLGEDIQTAIQEDSPSVVFRIWPKTSIFSPCEIMALVNALGTEDLVFFVGKETDEEPTDVVIVPERDFADLNCGEYDAFIVNAEKSLTYDDNKVFRLASIARIVEDVFHDGIASRDEKAYEKALLELEYVARWSAKMFSV